MVVRGIAVFVGLTAVAPVSHAESDFAVFVDVAPVVALPLSGISNLDTGVGMRIAFGIQTETFGFWIGYRKLWTAGHQAMQDDSDIWSTDRMLGGRYRKAVSPASFGFGDLYFAGVELDSRFEGTNITNGTWHGDGTGFGARGGYGRRLGKFVELTAALAVSSADVKYDSSKTVAWLAFELSVTGRY